MRSERSIFLEALDFDTDDARATFVTEACGEDAHLKASVEKLLDAHARPGNPLDEPVAMMKLDEIDSPADPKATADGIAETIGTEIGPYRLKEKIGEGGFGLVFTADQASPVRRRVALKIIKPNMDSHEVVAQFEAERQAIAMMDHPNIARILDAGTTTSGRPFFVMELVDGVPITEFCREHHLSLRARLELFLDVCHAVQHAHQKAVIHRDIKPSNVMVTQHDGKPIVKVIDFGIAKAIGHRLTERAISPRFTRAFGTPLYMSPEQIGTSGAYIDTRSDIYSLGVLLYELLTGSTPFEKDQFKRAGLDEARRIICEVVPPKPSIRLLANGTAPSTGSKPPTGIARRFSQAVRGDLDWIVMKALEKDKNRRYESASAMADDIRRFLCVQPIEERTSSRFYRFRKFARRHRTAFATGAIVMLSLVLATGVSFWQASVAMSERNEKDKALQSAVWHQQEADAARQEIQQFVSKLKEANILVTSGRAHAAAERWSQAWKDFTAAIEHQPNYYNAWTERGALAVQLGLWKLAASDYSKAIELGVPVDNPSNWGIPQLFLYNGDVESYRSYCRTMLEQAKQQERPPSIALIRSCVISAEPVSRADELAQEADRFLATSADDTGSSAQRSMPGPPETHREQKNPGVRFPPPGPPQRYREPHRIPYPRGASLYTAGIAHMRAKQYGLAASLLEEALDDDRWRARAITYPALAIAYYRLGQTHKAQMADASAKREINRWTEAMQQSPVGSMPIPWFDWIECLILEREAASLLTGAAPEEDPRLGQLQDRALSVIDGAKMEISERQPSQRQNSH